MLLEHVRQRGGQPELRSITPSLEDVFVSLTREAERERQPGRTEATEALQAAGRTAVSSRRPVNPHRHPSPRRRQRPTPRRAIGLRPHPLSCAPRRRVGRTTDGLTAIMVKEFSHIRRQPSTLFFMFVIPVIQTIIFGYAIDTQIEHIPMVVFDQDGRAEGQRLTEAFLNTRRFELVGRVLRRRVISARHGVGTSRVSACGSRPTIPTGCCAANRSACRC